MQYQGDLSPIAVTTGTGLASAGTVTITPNVKVPIGRLAKALFYVDVTATAGLTGSMVITYGYQVGEFKTATTTVSVTPIVVAGTTTHYKGIAAVSSTDYGTLYITTVKNETNKTLTTYDVGVTGMVMY